MLSSLVLAETALSGPGSCHLHFVSSNAAFVCPADWSSVSFMFISHILASHLHIPVVDKLKFYNLIGNSS